MPRWLWSCFPGLIPVAVVLLWHAVGTPSGGGSALQRSVRLPVSGLSLSLASMASFQASGRLFDGNGTQPDVVVQPNPEYYLVGGRDDVLERAIQMLRSAP